MTRLSNRDEGFSLIECMVSMGVMLFLMASVFHVLGKYQRGYQNEQATTDIRQGARGAMELLSQEVGQAGYLGSTPTPRALSASVTGNSTDPQTVALSSTANLFPGEKLLVDTGAASEVVAVTSVSGNSVSGIFRKNHNTQNVPVNTSGVFAQGVLLPPAPGQPTPNQLQIFGDINGDGILQYVEYTYDPAAGTLSRSITPYPDTVQGPARVLLRNLQPNPGGTDFFQYYLKPDNFGKTYRTEVTVTATTQTESPDPETKQYRTMTSSLVLTARNVLSARDLANNRLTDRIQTMTKTGNTCSWSILPVQFCTP